MRDEMDTVIAVVERSRLSGLLTVIHRAGHGPHARVLDPARGSLAGQLERAGVTGQEGLVAQATQAVVVLIHAPGRTAAIADLLQRAGAQQVVPVRRGVPAAHSPYAPPAWAGKFTLSSGGDERSD
jgi:ribosomal protein L2